MSCMCILDLSALKWSGNIPYWNKSRRSHYLTTLYVWTQKKWYIVTVYSWCFRLDKTLQDLVYKLVPGLYKSEYIVCILFMLKPRVTRCKLLVDAQSKTNCFQNKYNNTIVYCSILFKFHASSTNVSSIGAEAKADIICLSPMFHSRWLMLLEIEISFNDRNCYILGFNELKWNAW
jgi:hypothetical protein